MNIRSLIWVTTWIYQFLCVTSQSLTNSFTSTVQSLDGVSTPATLLQTPATAMDSFGSATSSFMTRDIVTSSLEPSIFSVEVFTDSFSVNSIHELESSHHTTMDLAGSMTNTATFTQQSYQSDQLILPSSVGLVATTSNLNIQTDMSSILDNPIQFVSDIQEHVSTSEIKPSSTSHRYASALMTSLSEEVQLESSDTIVMSLLASQSVISFVPDETSSYLTDTAVLETIDNVLSFSTVNVTFSTAAITSDVVTTFKEQTSAFESDISAITTGIASYVSQTMLSDGSFADINTQTPIQTSVSSDPSKTDVDITQSFGVLSESRSHMSSEYYNTETVIPELQSSDTVSYGSLLLTEYSDTVMTSFNVFSMSKTLALYSSTSDLYTLDSINVSSRQIDTSVPMLNSISYVLSQIYSTESDFGISQADTTSVKAFKSDSSNSFSVYPELSESLSQLITEESNIDSNTVSSYLLEKSTLTTIPIPATLVPTAVSTTQSRYTGSTDKHGSVSISYYTYLTYVSDIPTDMSIVTKTKSDGLTVSYTPISSFLETSTTSEYRFTSGFISATLSTSVLETEHYNKPQTSPLSSIMSASMDDSFKQTSHVISPYASGSFISPIASTLRTMSVTSSSSGSATLDSVRSEIHTFMSASLNSMSPGEDYPSLHTISHSFVTHLSDVFPSPASTYYSTVETIYTPSLNIVSTGFSSSGFNSEEQLSKVTSYVSMSSEESYQTVSVTTTSSMVSSLKTEQSNMESQHPNSVSATSYSDNYVTPSDYKTMYSTTGSSNNMTAFPTTDTSYHISTFSTDISSSLETSIVSSGIQGTSSPGSVTHSALSNSTVVIGESLPSITSLYMSSYAGTETAILIGSISSSSNIYSSTPTESMSEYLTKSTIDNLSPTISADINLATSSEELVLTITAESTVSSAISPTFVTSYSVVSSSTFTYFTTGSHINVSSLASSVTSSDSSLTPLSTVSYTDITSTQHMSDISLDSQTTSTPTVSVMFTASSSPVHTVSIDASSFSISESTYLLSSGAYTLPSTGLLSSSFNFSRTTGQFSPFETVSTLSHSIEMSLFSSFRQFTSIVSNVQLSTPSALYTSAEAPTSSIRSTLTDVTGVPSVSSILTPSLSTTSQWLTSSFSTTVMTETIQETIYSSSTMLSTSSELTATSVAATLEVTPDISKTMSDSSIDYTEVSSSGSPTTIKFITTTMSPFTTPDLPLMSVTTIYDMNATFTTTPGFSIKVSSTPSSMLSMFSINESDISATFSSTFPGMSTSASTTVTITPSMTTEPPDTTTEPPSQTTPNITSSGENVWVKTVLGARKSTDISSTAFRADLERRMAEAYNEAFRRERLIQQGLFENLRRKRYATVGEASVHIHDVTRIGDSTSVNVVYAVEKTGTILTPEEAVSSLHVLTTQELAIILQQVVQTVAEPYQSIEKPDDTDDEGIPLWLIAAITGSAAGLIILSWLFVCIYVKCCKEKKEVEKRSEPQLTAIQHANDSNDTPRTQVRNTDNERPGRSGRAESGGPRSGHSSKTSMTGKSSAYQVNKADEEALIENIPENLAEYENRGTTPTHLHNGTRQSPKVNSPTRQVGTVSNISMSHKHDLNPPTSSARKSGKSLSRTTVDRSYQGADFTDNIEPRSRSHNNNNKYHVLQSSFSDQDNDDLRERTRHERQKNKERVRIKKRGHRQRVENHPTQFLQTALGMPSTHLPSVHVDSGSPVKADTEIKYPVIKDPFLSSTNVGGEESLEVARTRMHRLLDDAFSLISPRASASDINQRSHDEQTLLPNEVPSTSSTSKLFDKRTTDLDPDPIRDEMYINPAYTQLSSPLETWSPYRTSDLVAMISMPSKSEPTKLGYKPKSATRPHSSKPNRRPTNFDFTESKSASTFEDDRFTTSPAKPIVIRTKENSDRRSDSGTKHPNGRVHSGRTTAMVSPLPKTNQNEQQYEMNSLKNSRNGSAGKSKSSAIDDRFEINETELTHDSDKLIKNLRDELSDLKDMYNVSSTNVQKKTKRKPNGSSKTQIAN